MSANPTRIPFSEVPVFWEVSDALPFNVEHAIDEYLTRNSTYIPKPKPVGKHSAQPHGYEKNLAETNAWEVACTAIDFSREQPPIFKEMFFSQVIRRDGKPDWNDKYVYVPSIYSWLPYESAPTYCDEI